METCWIFHPKYEKEIYYKVIRCFVNDFLEWTHNGYVWHTDELESEGWIKLTVYPDGSSNEYYTETCWHDEPIASNALTDDMLVLLTEAGVAHHGDCDEDEEEEKEWYLEDVDLQDVLGALSKQGTHVYVPCGEHLWMKSVDTGGCKKISILDFILAQKAA